MIFFLTNLVSCYIGNLSLDILLSRACMIHYHCIIRMYILLPAALNGCIIWERNQSCFHCGDRFFVLAAIVSYIFVKGLLKYLILLFFRQSLDLFGTIICWRCSQRTRYHSFPFLIWQLRVMWTFLFVKQIVCALLACCGIESFYKLIFLLLFVCSLIHTCFRSFKGISCSLTTHALMFISFLIASFKIFLL